MGKVTVSLIEELLLNKDWVERVLDASGMQGWRRYRIEYGYGGPEGVIYLPPHICPTQVEVLIEQEETTHNTA